MPRSQTGAVTAPFVDRLAQFGDRPALVTADETLTYTDLARRVEHATERLGTTRRLVLVAGANDVASVVSYLAALAGGHPAILVPGDNPANVAAVVAAYDPDVVLIGESMVERREGTRHRLHPDLALLLTTSGSTGSPKLVRLSAENLQANAAAIADYLRIRPDDVAATTLPMHYCYGLSVINSHLMAGASLLLTPLSVVDACFWDLFRRHGATTFAGVPYTFDLLDRVGFARMDLPSLRYVTQAGGRLPADQVRRYAALGRSRGWELFVMYGQTEATARMAYLPPALAESHPTAIGVPIPGGSFALEPLPELPLPRAEDAPAGEVGELLYSGPNVMLGYAETPADLALGRVSAVLRTGDVARRTPDGLYEIIGRRSRFAKVFGLRIDLDQVEQVLVGAGLAASCTDGDGSLVVAVDCAAGGAGSQAADVAGRVRTVAKAQLGLPPGAVEVVVPEELPRLANGKPDHRAVLALARAARKDDHHGTARGSRSDRITAGGHGPGRVTARGRGPGRVPAGGPDPVPSDRRVETAELRDLYAELLDRPDATDDDTFVTLEGDSLSYVEMSIRLEEKLGRLPEGWHVTPIRELVPSSRRRLRSLETNVLLRALAIVLIVGSHANLFSVAGGAHVLLGVAGFNFGRFHLTGAPRLERLRHLGTSIARVVVPSVLWIGATTAVAGAYTWQNVLLLNGVLGPREWSEPEWHPWFIEALVYTLVAMAALVALPLFDRLERRWPFWVPMGLAGLGLLTRYELVVLLGGDVIHRANVLFWLFALGWATVRATAVWQRVLVSAVVVATVPGFFGDGARDALVVAGLLMLVWLRAVPVPGWLARPAGVLASASLYIYLVHWQIYPHLEHRIPLLATVLSLLGGIAFWHLAGKVSLRRLPPWKDRPDGAAEDRPGGAAEERSVRLTAPRAG